MDVMKRVVVATALAVSLVLAPSAVAKPAGKVKLPLVPLQAAQLGAVESSLPLEHDSGVVSNAAAARSAYGNPTLRQFAKRVTGYQLDYGNPYLPGTGVREIETGVERYRSAAAAKHGLAFWRSDARKGRRDTVPGQPGVVGVSASVAKIRTPAVGAAHWALATTLEIANTSPVYSVREDVQDRNYVLTILVAAGSPSAAKQFVPRLAKAVHARLRAALAGKLHGTPATLPAKLTAGPPSSGPDPAKAALAPSDFTHATLSAEKYLVNEDALSQYDVLLQPADEFGSVQQEIMTESTPSEATYYAALDVATIRGLGAFFRSITPVDVSRFGDGAYGALLEHTVSGIPGYYAWVVLASGPIHEIFVGASPTPLAASAVTKLAQLGAKKLDSALAG